MIKKITQSLVVLSLAISCLYFADGSDIEKSEKKEKQIAVKEQKPVKLEVKKVDIPVVAKPNKPNKPKKKEPAYFVDIVDGYITEESIFSICKDVGNKYGIDPYILQSIAYTESRYYVRAAGSSNDTGLCQIVPKWNQDRIKRLGITDLYDPYSSILLCAEIMDELKGYEHGNDISYVLMAYNMGATGAKKKYESGYISDYAKKVLAKKKELESRN